MEGAQEVISLLTSIFSTVGPTLTLTSDNGSTLLRNRAVKSFHAIWGVQSVSLSLPYSPLHNARAEPTIKAFCNLMRLYTDKHENKWASLTDKITYMHNATPRLFQIDYEGGRVCIYVCDRGRVYIYVYEGEGYISMYCI